MSIHKVSTASSYSTLLHFLLIFTLIHDKYLSRTKKYSEMMFPFVLIKLYS